MKKLFNQWRLYRPLLKSDLKMKLTTMLWITTLFGLHANDGYAQRTKVTLEVENVTVKSIIDQIESTTEFRFIYKTKDVDLQRKFSFQLNKEHIETVMEILFGNTTTEYKIRGSHIVLKRGRVEKRFTEEPPTEDVIEQVQDFTTSGTVTDANGSPLP